MNRNHRTKKGVNNNKKPLSRWKALSYCGMEENILHMIRKFFYSDALKPVKVGEGLFEIHSYDKIAEDFRVRHDKKKGKFLFEQKIN